MKGKTKHLLVLLLTLCLMLAGTATATFSAGETHEWSAIAVSTDGTSASVSCDGEAGSVHSVTLQLEGENATYDGQPHGVTLPTIQTTIDGIEHGAIDTTPLKYQGSEYGGGTFGQNYAPTNAGDYTAEESFQIRNTDGSLFDQADVKKEFSIAPADLTVTWDPTGDLHYTGGEQDLTYEVSGAVNGENPVYTLEIVDADSRLNTPIKDVGDYIAVLALETDITSEAVNRNYKWAGEDYDARSLEHEFKVTKNQVTPTWSVPDDGLVYTGSEQVPTLTITTDPVESGVDTPTAENTVVTYEDDAGNPVASPINAGKYKATATLDSNYTNNFEWAEGAQVTYEFEIVKSKVKVTWDGDEFTYNKQVQKPEYTLTSDNSGAVPTLTDNEYTEAITSSDGVSVDDPVNADSYTYELTLVDTDNYEWADGAETSHDFKINPKPVYVEWGDDTSFQYDGQDHVPSVDLVPNYVIDGDDLQVTAKGAQKAVGTGYIATAELTGTSKTNYVIEDTAEHLATCEFEITAKKVKIVWSNTELTYNGEEQFPTAKVDQSDLVAGESCTINSIKAYGEEGCTTAATSKDAGTYYAKAEGLSNDNYVIDADTAVTKFVINKKTITAKIESGTFEYDGTPQAPEATLNGLIGDDALDNEVTPKITGDKADNGQAIHAGKYTATVDEECIPADLQKNYALNATKTKKFVIDPKRVSIVWYRPANNKYGDYVDANGDVVESVKDAAVVECENGEVKLVFNGKKQAPTAKVNERELSSYNGGDTDTCTVTVTASDNAIEVGEYEAQKINLSNPDYTADDAGTSYEIVARPVKLEWAKYYNTYNGEEQIPEVKITNVQQNVKGKDYASEDGVVEISKVKLTDGVHFGEDGEDADETDPWLSEEKKPAESLTDGSEIAEDRAGIDAGTYNATPSGLTDSYNYTFVLLDPETNLPQTTDEYSDDTEKQYTPTYSPIYTIHQYKITKINWDNTSVTYNASYQLPTAEVGDLQTGDTADQVKLVLADQEQNYTEDNYAGECNAGNYKVYIGSYKTGKTGERAMNYMLDSEKVRGTDSEGEEDYGYSSFTINKKALTITAKNKTINYGDDPAKVTYDLSYSGLINGDVNTTDKLSNGKPGTYTVDGETKDVVNTGDITVKPNYSKNGKPGTYAIVVSASGDVDELSDNYAVTFKNGKLTVNNKVLSGSQGNGLLARAKGGNKKGTIYWTKVSGAAKYKIYYSPCNTSKKKYTPKYYKTVTGNKLTIKKLKKKTFYKYYVVAVDKNGKKIAQTEQHHFCTNNVSGKYTNAKKIKASAGSISVSKGSTKKVSAKVTKVKSNKKLLNGPHTVLLRYRVENPAVASVNSKGVVTGKSAGWTRLYVMAPNGLWTTVEVTVK